MDKIFTNTKLIFVAIFAVIVAAVWAYEVYYVIPARKCEAAGNWWAAKWRACGVPVKITVLTGRPIAQPNPEPATAGGAAPPAAPLAKAP